MMKNEFDYKKENISKWFTWFEAIYLKQLDRCAEESELNDEIKENLKKLFLKLDEIRDYFGRPIKVHCAFRPESYNKMIGGAKNSAHKVGLAVDFHISGVSCDQARETLIPLLEKMAIRMEKKPLSNWVHIDLAEVKCKRYFEP